MGGGEDALVAVDGVGVAGVPEGLDEGCEGGMRGGARGRACIASVEG